MSSLESIVDQCVQAICNTDLPNKCLCTSKEFRAVIRAFLLCDHASALNKSKQLLCFMHGLQGWSAAMISQYQELDWDCRKRRAVEFVHQAADQLDDPVQGSDASDLGKAWEWSAEDLQKKLISPAPNLASDVTWYTQLDLLPLALRSLAQQIEDQDAWGITPLRARVQATNSVVSPSNIGSRGGATNENGATTGLLIRELDKRVPDDTKKYALISGLMHLMGRTDVTRQRVRAILLKGRT